MSNLNVEQGEHTGGNAQSGFDPDRGVRTATRTLVGSLAVLGLSAALLLFLWLEAVATAPVRDGMRVYTQLISSANRGDLATASRLCTSNYLNAHPLRLAEEGGIVGLPRTIHKNFHAWRNGTSVWVFPGNWHDRIGPVYKLMRIDGQYRFDGLVGELRPGNTFAQSEGH